MEIIEEFKKKLQCEKCNKSYDAQNPAWLCDSCRHHSCGSCTKGLFGKQCPACNGTARSVTGGFLNGIYTLLDQYELKAQEKNDHKCVECGKSDSEQDMQLCKTCHDLKFEDHEDVKKHALCPACAIKKHMRQGHQSVDFYPYLSAYNFSSKSSEIDAKIEVFKGAQISLENTISHFEELSINVSENFSVLTDMARRSKNTKNQVEFIEKMETFIDESKSINVRADSDMKKHATELEGNLAKIKKWYESKLGNCVDESEIIKLPKPEDAQEDVTEIDA